MLLTISSALAAPKTQFQSWCLDRYLLMARKCLHQACESTQLIIRKLWRVKLSHGFQQTLCIPTGCYSCPTQRKFDLTKMSWWDHDILTANSHEYFNATSEYEQWAGHDSTPACSLLAHGMTQISDVTTRSWGAHRMSSPHEISITPPWEFCVISYKSHKMI